MNHAKDSTTRGPAKNGDVQGTGKIVVNTHHYLELGQTCQEEQLVSVSPLEEEH